MATEAQLKANKKYHDKFELIRIRVTPEEKASIEAYAEKHGESVNAFVRRVIASELANGTATAPNIE